MIKFGVIIIYSLLEPWDLKLENSNWRTFYMSQRRRRRSSAPTFDPDKRVLGLGGVRRHRPYVLIKDGKQLDVLCMTKPYLLRHPDRDIGQLWYADMVDTNGEHHKLMLYLFGLCSRPGGGMANTDYNVLLHSDRVVSNQELGKAECVHWEHSREYKMEQAAAIARLFLKHNKVKAVSLYGSLARGENGADYDMVIHVCPSLAWKNLQRAEEKGRGVSVLTSHYKINKDLIWLLDLNQEDQQGLLDLIVRMKLDLQVLPQPMNQTFRQHFMSGAQRTGRDNSYEHDFLTEIESDFARFDPTSGTFCAKKAAP